MKRALLTYRTGNIGDDVQSLALAQPHLLGEPDLWIDRDQLQDYAEEGPVHLIANGFFLCRNREGQLSFPPPPNIDVTYVALCASNIPDSMETRKHMAESGPVGCRDKHTMAWCDNRGVEHYFASCPSCLLGRGLGEEPDESAPPYDPKGPIVVVDTDPNLLPPFGVSDRQVIMLTNRVHPAWYPTPELRFKALRKKLRVLRSASLVITRRLHVTMPCLGMGVPVVIAQPTDLPFRMTALPPWMKIHAEEELRHISMDPARHRTDDYMARRAEWIERVAKDLMTQVATRCPEWLGLSGPPTT